MECDSECREDKSRNVALDVSHVGGTKTLLTCSKGELTKKMISGKHQKMLRQRQIALQKQQGDAARAWRVTAQQDIALPSRKVQPRVLNEEFLMEFLENAPSDQQRMSRGTHIDNFVVDEHYSAQEQVCKSAAAVSQLSTLWEEGPVSPDHAIASQRVTESETPCEEITPKSSSSRSRVRSLSENLRLACPSPCKNLKLWESLKRPGGSARVAPQSQTGAEDINTLITVVSPKEVTGQLIAVSPKGTGPRTGANQTGHSEDSPSNCGWKATAIDID